MNPETGLFEPEHVNVFGVPFSFLPHEGRKDGPPQLPRPKITIEPVKSRTAHFLISWPNVVRIDHSYRPRLSLDMDRVEPLYLDAANTTRLAELAPIIDGKPDISKIDSIGLEQLADEFRTQRIIFETARDVYDQMQESWSGNRMSLLAQLVRLVEQFMQSGKIRIMPDFFDADDPKRRIVITLNMTKVMQHIWEAIRFENTKRLEPIFDRDQPIRTTSDMRTWFTGRPCAPTTRSHINWCVLDSTWEGSDALALDHASEVDAWVKNDHLGFEVFYVYRGVVRKYRPDFLVRLTSGDMLILETKGIDTDRDRTKRKFLAEWVKAVNAHGGFGHWAWDVTMQPGEVYGVLERHCRTDP